MDGVPMEKTMDGGGISLPQTVYYLCWCTQKLNEKGICIMQMIWHS